MFALEHSLSHPGVCEGKSQNIHDGRCQINLAEITLFPIRVFDVASNNEKGDLRSRFHKVFKKVKRLLGILVI